MRIFLIDKLKDIEFLKKHKITFREFLYYEKALRILECAGEISSELYEQVNKSLMEHHVRYSLFDWYHEDEPTTKHKVIITKHYI